MKAIQIKLFLILFVLPCFVSAQNKKVQPQKTLSQLKIDGWDTEHDLPTAGLTDIYQSKDGYLWISSYSGLIRFDGVKFTTYDKKVINFLQSPSVNAVVEDKNNTLWIATNGSGLIAYKGGVFEYFGRNEQITGFNILNLLIDKSEEKIWIGTRNHGLWTFDLKTKKFSEFKTIPHLENSTITSMLIDSNHKLWIGTDGKGLFSYQNNKFEVFSVFNGKIPSKFVFSILQDKAGNLWIGTNKGLFKQFDDKFVEIAEVSGFDVSCLLEDRNHNIWIGTSNGIFRRNGETGIYEHLQKTEMFSKIHPYGFYEDHEGSIWAALYNSGLMRCKESNFINFTRQDGLASKAVDAVLEIGKNDYLIGTDVGIVNRIRNGKTEIFSIKTDLKNERIRFLYQDKSATIWVASYLGLLKILPNGTEKLYGLQDSLADIQTRAVHEHAQTGDLWVGTKSAGITIFLKNGTVKQVNKTTGLVSDFIMSMEESHDGKMIISTNDGGISIISKDGKLIANYNMSSNKKDGLNSNLVFSTHVDVDENIWIVTNMGISLLQSKSQEKSQNELSDIKITNINAQDIGLMDSPFDIVEDNDENFWIPTNKGILRVAKKDLLGFVEGKVKKIHYRIFDQSDGMKSASCTGAVSGYQDSNNYLWFPTIDGVSCINPSDIRLNDMPPPIVIEGFLTDSLLQNLANKNIALSNISRVTFRFTATSLIAPNDIIFRHKLLGYDNQWHEGKSREMSYTNLPVGDYEFQVTACNNDEVWNPTVSKVTFSVKPQYYQTIWFYVLVILGISTLLYLIYKLRLAQINQKNIELARLVAERTAEISLKKEEIEAQANAIHEQKIDLEKAYQRIQTLSAMGQKITTKLNLTELVRTIYDYLHFMMPAEGFGIGIYNGVMNRMEFTGYMEKDEELPFHFFSMNQTEKLAISCFVKQEEIMINNYLDYLKKNNLKATTDLGEIPNSIIYLPLSIENKQVGVITVQSFAANAYSENELTLLKSLVSYISIAIDNAHAYEIIADKNQKITDSIHYAKHIQAAMLPPTSHFDEYFGLGNAFVLFKPKDIVSGDFYWIAQEDRYTVVAVVDCTGHGVPGAFMSMIGSSSLNDLVIAEGFKNPSVILKRMNKRINEFFNRKTISRENQILDGMDMAILVFHKDLKTNKFTKVFYAGAMNPLYYMRNGKGVEVKATKKPIGGSELLTPIEYESHEIDLTNNKTSFYLFSDGYSDQFGGKGNKKFRTKNFREGLFSISNLEMYEQKEVLSQSITNWQGDEEQTDDITVVGILIDNSLEI